MTVFEETGALTVFVGSVPTTAAVFTTEPLLRSLRTTAWVAEQVVLAPGIKTLARQVIAEVAFASDTVTEVMVTLPVFLTVKE